jgi:hypothetical protein
MRRTQNAQLPPKAGRSPIIAAGPQRPNRPILGDVWLRDGEVWGFTTKGWRRYL